MKKEILSAIGIIAGILFGTTLSLSAQEKLSLKQCREMALKYNKEMAAADRQTEAARLMSLSYKANFFPNFTANGTGIYSTADGSFGIPGGNLPVFIIRKSKFPQNPKRSVRFSGKRTKRSVQKRKARNTQKAETKVL